MGITELQERLEMSEKYVFPFSKWPSKRRTKTGKKIEIFRQEEDLCIASLAKWDARLKGLVELERRCQNTRQEIQA